MVGSIVYSKDNEWHNIFEFVNKLSYEPDITEFIVDLSAATYIDSTNLGILAQINTLSRSRNKLKPTLITTNRNVTDILRNVGFFSLFAVIDNVEYVESGFKDLPKAQGDASLGEVMLKAHKILSEINQENAAEFKDVIEFLESDLGKS